MLPASRVDADREQQPDLVALDAKLASYGGRSDHRGVIATLAVQ